MKNKQTLLLLAAGAVIVVLLVVFVLLSGGGDDGLSPGDDVITSREDPTAPGGGGIDPVTGTAQIDPVEQLEIYRRWSQYPPWSRPLHEGMVDLLDPYNSERPPVGVISRPARGCATVDGTRRCEEEAQFSEIQCDMQPEASISVGKDDFNVFVACRNPKGETVPIENLQVKVYRELFRERLGMLPPIHAGDDGEGGDKTAGDGVYTITVRPTDKAWGPVYVEIDGTVAGHRHNQRRDFYSTPHSVAEFGEPVQDARENGDLAFQVPVQVNKAGYYQIEANLQEAGGEERLIASTYWEGRLEAGRRSLDLKFFGKIISDAGIDGPYKIRDIRGKRNNSAITPDQVRAARETGESLSAEQTEPIWEYIQPVEKSYTSREYSANEFARDPWDSEEKRERLRFLERVAEGG